MKWKVDLHSHTIYSTDCLTRPKALIRRARELGLDKIAVTEHNNLAGALAAKALAPDLVIVGEEIKTTQGEIIAYYVREEVPRGLSPQETIARLRSQGAVISILVIFVAFIIASALARVLARSQASPAMQYTGLGLYVFVESIVLAPILWIITQPEISQHLFGSPTMGWNLIGQATVLTLCLFAGLTATGCQVHDLGIAPTPTVGFAVQHRKAAGAVQITASHNPAPWNGLKLFGPDGAVLSPEAGRGIRSRYDAGDFRFVPWDQVGSSAECDQAGGNTPECRNGAGTRKHAGCLGVEAEPPGEQLPGRVDLHAKEIDPRRPERGLVAQHGRRPLRRRHQADADGGGGQ